VHLAVDFDVDLVEMPLAAGLGAHVLDPLPADLAGEHRAESISPKTDRLVADVDAAHEQQVLDVSRGQRVSGVHHHGQPDHLRRGVKVAKRVV
jgi:hypothetical protein